MTVETYLVNSVEDRYGEELASLVDGNLQDWAEEKQPEEDTRFGDLLQSFVYPYVAAAETLLENEIDGEEVKRFVAELLEKQPAIPSEMLL